LEHHIGIANTKAVSYRYSALWAWTIRLPVNQPGKRAGPRIELIPATMLYAALQALNSPGAMPKGLDSHFNVYSNDLHAAKGHLARNSPCCTAGVRL
jgi:hypothetical protein